MSRKVSASSPAPPARQPSNLGIPRAFCYGRDVPLLPLEQVNSMIGSAGFETPVLFFQTCLIHAWYAKRTSAVA